MQPAPHAIRRAARAGRDDLWTVLGLERGCEVEDVARAHQRAMADMQPSARPAELGTREVEEAVRGSIISTKFYWCIICYSSALMQYTYL